MGTRKPQNTELVLRATMSKAMVSLAAHPINERKSLCSSVHHAKSRC